MAKGRTIHGKVVKVAGIKTATIVVERKVMHPKYHKTVKRFKKYLIHDEKSQLDINDVVTAVQCRPISKRKSFRLGEVVSKGVK